MFFHNVWSTLASTGVGETVSYKELARLSGKPNAARAAGQAVKKHCLPILIPCHRVVKSGRGPKGCVNTGDYSGGEGPATKEWLLEHEKKMLQGSEWQLTHHYTIYSPHHRHTFIQPDSHSSFLTLTGRTNHSDKQSTYDVIFFPSVDNAKL